MKRAVTFAWAALAAGMLAACAEGPTSPGTGLGTFDGAWDGAAWRGSAYAVLQGDSLFVAAHRPDPNSFYDEYIRARVRFTGPGTYAVSASQGGLDKVVGGDAGSFREAAGTLVIRGYDAAAHTVSGEITLRATSAQPAWNVHGDFDAPVYPNAAAVPAEPSR